MTVVNPPTTAHPSFAKLLQQLFEERRHSSGRAYTVAEVAMAFPKRSAEKYLYKLLSGEIREPRRPTIAALCRFFKIDPSYFFPELADVLPFPPFDRS